MAASTEPLFAPMTLGSVPLKNRIVMSPMTRGFSPGGVPGEDVAAYYRRRAEADVGLIVTEGIGVDHPAALGFGGAKEGEIPVLHGAQALAGWRRVVDDVHAAGGVIFPQLWHQGVIREPGTGRHPEAPSCRPSGLWGPDSGASSLPRDYVERVRTPTQPMTESEIADVIAAFGRSAANAKSVGFDGIAIHGAHGYLIDTFFWSETNHRTDIYGGDIERRSRFGAEVVKAIRAEVGPDLPIMFRFSQWKQQDFNGRLANTPDELGRVLAPLVDAGVDVFDVSTRRFAAPAFDGSDKTLAGWTKIVTGKPTMAVGGIGLKKDIYESFMGGGSDTDDLSGVIDRLVSGEFDLIAVGRSLLNDPTWALKARRGEPFLPFRLDSITTLH